jgi:hypothetical protein
LIRAALGAGRARLVRQLFAEGLTLGAIGGLMGLGLAWIVLALLVGLAPEGIPRLTDASLDGNVVLFATALTAGTSLIFGVLSAGRTLQLTPWRALAAAVRETRLAGQPPPARRRLNALAAAELGMTMVLLVAAGLLLRSFVALVDTDQGFESGGALALQINLPGARYPTPAARLAYTQRLLDRLKREPALTSVGLATTMPTRQPTGRFGFSSSPSILSASDPFSIPVVDVHMVSDGFVEAMGLRLIEGRSFSPDDRGGAEAVVIISEQFARRQFPGRSAVHQTLYSGTGNRRVVGVIATCARRAGAAPARTPMCRVPGLRRCRFAASRHRARARPQALATALRPIVRRSTGSRLPTTSARSTRMSRVVAPEVQRDGSRNVRGGCVPDGLGGRVRRDGVRRRPAHTRDWHPAGRRRHAHAGHDADAERWRDCRGDRPGRRTHRGHAVVAHAHRPAARGDAGGSPDDRGRGRTALRGRDGRHIPAGTPGGVDRSAAGPA